MGIITILKRLHLAGLFLLLLIVMSCDDQPTQVITTENTIQGTIVDESGIGVPNAVVQITSPETIMKTNRILEDKLLLNTRTDEDGKFKIEKLPHDLSNLKLKIIHGDFRILSANLQSVIAGKDRNNLVLCMNHDTNCKGRIIINVFNGNDSTALGDVLIMMKKGGELLRKAKTDAQGRIVFDYVCPGDYIFHYYKNLYSIAYDTVTTNSTDTIILNKYLIQTSSDSCCQGKIVITARDSSTNTPLAGMKAYLKLGGTTLTHTLSDNSGIINFNDLCPGDYSIHLIKSGYNTAVLNFHLDCDDSTGAEVILSGTTQTDSCCDGILKVFLIDKNTGKAPTNKVTVNLLLNGKVIQSQAGTSYTYFSKLCQGNYQVHIVSSYYETLIFDYISHCNAKDTVTKHLVPTSSGDSCCNGVINLVFKDSATSALLKGASVYLYNGSIKIAAQSTDINGAVRFTGICKGDFTVKSSLSGYNSYNFTITMDCNDTNSSVIYLSKIHKSTDSCCTGVLTVTVLDSADGTPVHGATVYAIKPDGTTISGTTDSTGRYTFQDICAPLTYKIKALKSGYNHNYIQVRFDICNTQYVTVRIYKP